MPTCFERSCARRVVALVKGGSLAEIDPPRTAVAGDRSRASALTGKLLAGARINDLTSTLLHPALAVLKDGGRALATCNHHLGCDPGIHDLACPGQETSGPTPCRRVRLQCQGRSSTDRRTLLEPDELRRLVEAALRRGDLPRDDRASPSLCYRLAVSTGLRFLEIASVTPESFVAGPPVPPR